MISEVGTENGVRVSYICPICGQIVKTNDFDAKFSMTKIGHIKRGQYWHHSCIDFIRRHRND